MKKRLKFVLSREDSSIDFNLDFILLPVKVNLILEQQGCKKDVLVTYDISYIEIILALLTEVVALYMQASIIQVGLLGLKRSILGCKIYVIMFLAFNK